MTGQLDNNDKKEARNIALVIVVLFVLLGVATFLMLPLLGAFVAEHLSPGLGLKNAAVIAFFLTIVTLIVLAFAAGDGLLGEIQFLLGGFLLFFLISWVMLAWIF